MERFADWDTMECQTGTKKRGKKNRNGRKNKGGEAGNESTDDENVTLKPL
jgi:hypothetical protein